MEKDNKYILSKVENAFPNKLPIGLVDSTELARLVGQQDVVMYIRRLLNIENEKEQEIK